MKRVLSLSCIVFALCMSSHAQTIVGKWECTPEFLDGMGLKYDELRGYCKFKKNGLFEIKINGMKRMVRTSLVSNFGKRPVKVSSVHRMMRIKVKGSFAVEDGRISTVVAPEDVHCFIDPGLELPKEPDVADSDYAVRRREMEQRRYDRAAFEANVQAQTVKNDLMRSWRWKGEPLEVTEKSLLVGGRTFFKR